ncbi:hypothetical protein Bca52824_061022 [Brassica carinata]|uniref:FRIGIDA-like protein n=1 Tax=Brassica carinata TaxID=52824 RepID=A0A8X7QYQ9_BRACI|nr:hypothetical protein Bca52824_061022 [Brassica carinata]
MDELNICRERGEGLRKALDEVYAYASNVVDARILALQVKEVELKDKSFALEERAKKVVEAKRKELNFLRYQVEISGGESNAEGVRLSEVRRLVEECEAERVLKASELSEMVESCGEMKTELERYHAQVRAEMESLRKLDEEAERKLKDLTLVQEKVEGCEKMFEKRSSEVVSKEKELEVVCMKIDLREKTVMSLNNDMKEACQRMENVQKLIEERSAHCESLKLLIEEHNQQLASAEIAPGVSPEATINNSVASLSHLPNEDALLRDMKDSTSLLPNEVSTELPMFKDPGRFVLTSVEKALTDANERGELSLEEAILMPLVPLLEERARVVVISTDPDLQSDATRKSQLEAWAVLQFIVAFGLVKQTQPNQTLQLASYVSHFKHAPKLFESLGLTHAIPNFVTQLFDKGLYIPAIRFMLSFNVKNNSSSLELLKEQIINLRLSAKENRRYESQAEEATMMDIMELIEDFKLEIDIPVDLILKFMVPREIQEETSSSVPVQPIQRSSCADTQGSNPSLPTSFGTESHQAGGSTALLQGQKHSHHAGSKRPTVDPEGSDR